MTVDQPNTFEKDPDAVLDFGVNWTPWLNGDTIINSVWDVPSGITGSSSSHNGKITTIWLSGGEDKKSYSLTNHITTAAGREDDRTIIILGRPK